MPTSLLQPVRSTCLRSRRMATKVCTCCGETKSVEAFQRNCSSRDGRLNQCAECRNSGRRITDRVELAQEGKQRCGKCGEVKLFEEFSRHASRSTGRRKWCRSCAAAENKAWRERTAYKTSPDIAKQWRKANPEAARRIGRRGAATRRARLHDAFVEQVDPIVVYQRDKGICGICEEAVDPNAFDVDHIEPLALGGKHSYDNVRVAHPSCNRSRPRAAMDEEE